MLTFTTNVQIVDWCHTFWPFPLLYTFFIGVIHVDLRHQSTPCLLVSYMLTFPTNVHLVHFCHTCLPTQKCKTCSLVSYMLTFPTTVHLFLWCHTCWPSPQLYTLFIGVIHIDLPHYCTISSRTSMRLTIMCWMISHCVIHVDLTHNCTHCLLVSYMLTFTTTVHLVHWCHTCSPSQLLYTLFIGVIHVYLPYHFTPC